LQLSKVKANAAAADLARNRALATLVDNLPAFVNLEEGLEAHEQSYLMLGCTPVIIIRIREKEPRPEPLSQLPPAQVLIECKNRLDVSLFQNPNDSISWYLRAACSLALNDEDSALRDLRRMSKIEMEDTAATTRRILALESLQGHLRQMTSALADRALLQVANGHRPASLAELQAKAAAK
jgi:hypothetical protein